MRTLILKVTKTYPEVIAHQTTNNFGDQIIEIVRENLDGSKNTIYTDMNPEGNWVPFTKKSLAKKII